MERLLFYSFILLTFLSSPFASARSLNSYYCIAHHGTIHLGDSTKKVKTACGEPTQTIEGNQGQRTPPTKQIVTYSGSNGIKNHFVSNTMNKQQSNLSGIMHKKSDVVIELENNTIVAIRVGKMSKQKTRACGGFIQVGDSAKQLIKRCGHPTNTHLVNQTQKQLNHQQHWEYHLDDYAQSLQLQFINGRLSHISFGAMGGG